MTWLPLPEVLGPLPELYVDAASHLHKLFSLFPEIALSTGISAESLILRLDSLISQPRPEPPLVLEPLNPSLSSYVLMVIGSHVTLPPLSLSLVPNASFFLSK